MFTIDDHRSLIDCLGGNSEVARFGGWPAVTVGQWKVQNRIPPEYWQKIIEFAEQKGFAQVTTDWMLVNWPARKNSALPNSADIRGTA